MYAAYLRSAYNGLYSAYKNIGFSDETAKKLRSEIPGNDCFNSRGVYNYYDGGNIFFGGNNVLNWIISHTKQE